VELKEKVRWSWGFCRYNKFRCRRKTRQKARAPDTRGRDRKRKRSSSGAASFWQDYDAEGTAGVRLKRTNLAQSPRRGDKKKGQSTIRATTLGDSR